MLISKRLAAAGCLAVGALVVAVGINPLSNNDIWLHITTGELILERWAVPAVDEYSFTHAGSPYVAHEWLAQVFLALVFRWAGVTGLILLKPTAMAAAAGLVAVLCRRLGGSPQAALGAAMVAVVAITSHLYVRPHLFTLVMIPLAMLLLIEVKQGSRRALGALMLLQIAWANLHGGFIIGIVMAAAMGAWAAAAGEALASVLNPYGVHLFSFVLGFADPVLRRHVREWGSPLDEPFFGSFHFYFFLLLLAGSAVATVHLVRRRRFDGAALIALFGVLSFVSKRHVSLLGVAAAPWLGAAFSGRSGGALHTGLRRRLVASIVGVFLLAAAAAFHGVPHEAGRPRRMGLGVGPQVAGAAMDFAVSNGLEGNALVSYGLGAYVIYRAFPAARVSIDSRTDVHGSDFVAEYARAMADPSLARALLARYPIDYAVLSYRHEEVEGPVLALDADPRWALVYFDDQAMIYVARDSRWSDLVARSEYVRANPYLYLSGRQGPENPPGEVLAESTRALEAAPESVVAHMMAGTALQAAGDHAEAAAVLEEAADLMITGDQGEAVLAGLLGTSYVALGKEEKAVEAFTRLLSLVPDSVYAREMLREIRSRSSTSGSRKAR